MLRGGRSFEFSMRCIVDTVQATTRRGSTSRLSRRRAGCSCRDGWRCRLHGSRIWTNDLRAILDNDVAIKAYRERKLPFPNGTIIVRLAWSYVPSEENNKVFGRPQSFVAGPPTNGVQFMVKDSRK